MTGRDISMNPLDAVYAAARGYPGGVEALAVRLGMPSSTLYKKLRPAIETHHVNLEDFSMIIEALDDVGRFDKADLAFEALAWRHGRVVIRMPDHQPSAKELLRQVTQLMKEKGDLANNLGEALFSDGRIDDQEYEQIQDDLKTCVTSLVMLSESVKAKHEADCK